MSRGGAEVVIGLSAVVVTLRGDEACVLLARRPDGEPALPSGPFDPQGHRTFELALRDFVADQAGFALGFVEQLYTFGDQGRDAPRAELGRGAARVVSVGYLGLTGPLTAAEDPRNGEWSPLVRFFPWEDWREGRPPIIDQLIMPALADWAKGHAARGARIAGLFAGDGARWNEDRVLERYELLYEAGLVAEAARDRGAELFGGAARLGQPLASDHRRILATGLGRLRSKLKYRAVIFDLMAAEFTLGELQKATEAVAGLRLHKQNFRRTVERTGLVMRTGRLHAETGGRPAELFRFNRSHLGAGLQEGLSLPRDPGLTSR
ncbi:NAD regulator [Brevundimonas sp. 2R-24]|uniref:NAD regulator n=1 Tax=Peiella sedimenti TaxID=3061083 RepID=A0ABT8SL72_9CAUL|nr:NAD regulator [Caulobacteraceae bacterium XZ-24]